LTDGEPTDEYPNSYNRYGRTYAMINAIKKIDVRVITIFLSRNYSLSSTITSTFENSLATYHIKKVSETRDILEKFIVADVVKIIKVS